MTDWPQTKSLAASAALADLVPGGAHTYAKGPEQYPADTSPIIARGQGCRVWDIDGNEYVEFGSGLRSVILGHAHPEVLDAVRVQLSDGSNFARPSELELLAAHDFIDAVPSAEMVKFAKNGSDATTAAVRLARAVTGREQVAICADHPFFSTDDWFIGATTMPSGIPAPTRSLTSRFPYADLAALEQTLSGNNIAAVVLEPETRDPAPEGYLAGVIKTAHRHGTLVIIDEMISGFRTALAGAHARHHVTPDLVTFGKAIGNGFAISALAGRRELMERGGRQNVHDQVFLLSTTHGGEGHALAALRSVMSIHRRDQVSDQLRDNGIRVRAAVQQAIASEGLAAYISIFGQPQNLVFATLDESLQPSQPYRTLLLRELLRHGVLAPSLVVSTAIDDAAIDQTATAFAAAARTYAEAIDHGDPTPWMGGRSVQPVFRPAL